MILRSLEIRREDWGVKKGMLEGDITYQGEHGTIKVLLNPDHCARILEIVGDALVKTSQDIAINLTSEIINATPALTSKV